MTTKKKIEFTEHEQKIIDYIRRNRDKRDLFITTIVHVSPSGMSRQIRFAIIYKGNFQNVTYLMGKVMGEKLTNKDAIRVGGCGMDMIFATLLNIYSSLGYKSVHRLAATQNYRYF